MSAPRPIDSKREEFRKYLERGGVMDALTKVLVMLYEEPEKPEDPLEYVRTNMGDKRPSMAEIEAMKSDLESALLKIQSLEQENIELKARVDALESGEINEGGDEDETADDAKQLSEVKSASAVE